MKRFTILFAIVLCLFASQVFGAANAETKNTTTNKAELEKGTDYVVYSGATTTLTALDSIGAQYTKAMYIAPFQTATDLCLVYLEPTNDAHAGEDCNVLVQFSNDLETWTLGSANSGVIRDDLATTALVDTVNYAAGTRDWFFNTFDYMRLKFDYQAGNPIGSKTTWRVKLKKPTGVDFPKNLVEIRSSTD